MASAELPQPGVEVIQEFRSTSPTIVTPTLVPCAIAPFFEIIEVLNSDGTVNSDAKLLDPYEQFELLIGQSSFPSPRGNIDEVDVQEDSVRVFFDFGGSLVELSQEQAFLASINISTRPYVMGTDKPVGFDLDGRTLIFQLDSHTAVPPVAANLPTSADITVEFSATTPGGTLTIDEVVAQINNIVPGVAFNAVDVTGVGGDDGKLALQSTRWGARASVVVRETGSANDSGLSDRLGFSTAEPELAVGAGFYAVDDGDSDLLSPRIELYKGTSQRVLSAGDVPEIGAFSFTSYSIEVGDTLYMDGVDIGEVSIVTADRLTMEIEQNTMSANSPFAPRRCWVRANNLSYPAPASSTSGTQTGTQQTAAEVAAYIVGGTPSFPIGPSESFSVDVVADGVVQDTETISSGSGWADLATAVIAINAAADNFEAYAANDVGDEVVSGTYLGLRCKADNTGSGSAITYSSGTSGMTLGFSANTTDVGENIRYLPGTVAFTPSVAPIVSTAGTETVTYTPTVLGVAKSPETISFGVNGTLALVVTDWNNQALYTEAYKSDVSGNESATGTYLAIRTIGENVGTGAVINITADSNGFFTGAPPLSVAGTNTDLDGKTFKWSLDNNPKEFSVVLVADEDDGGTSLQSIIDKINAETINVASASTDDPPYLKLTSQKVGRDSEMEVLDGDANSILGFSDDTSVAGSGRPNPDMAFDLDGSVVLQGQLLRDGLTGSPYSPAWAPVYIAYKALRLDVSPDAENPGLLTIDDISTLEEIASPISTDNPGALLTYLMLLNAPGVTVATIGVPEVSADAPDGTPLGYAKCAEFLENEEVYALCAASHNPAVHQTFQTHVNFMSEPEQKGERIFFANPEIPNRDRPTLLASGTDANSTSNENELTVDVNVAPALIAAGIDPNSAINPLTGDIENEVYIDLGTDDKYYLVQAVTAGTTLKLRTAFSSGDGNDDSFYSEDSLPTGIISDNWTLSIRGDELVVPGSTRPDRARIADTVSAAASTYGDRRFYYTFPDQCGVNVTGLEQIVNGYYATGCVAGMVGQQPPQQGFTNFPITGLTRVVGSNDAFTNRQMNVMAAGGVYILIQEVEGAPVTCRHQLSSDTSTIETRELSITKIVDYCAKYYRSGLRNYIGRSNITQAFLDNLGTVVQGLNAFLSDNGVIIGADVNNLIQDADNPDTVLLDITLDVPYPCNYIRIVLVI